MTIEELTIQLQQRDAVIAQCNATIAEMAQTMRQLNDQLAWCKRQLFGRKSERYEDPGQPRLFTESDDDAHVDAPPPSPEVMLTIASHDRHIQRRGKRQPIPDDLRREVIVHDLPEQEKIDPVTGQALLTKIGEDARERIAFKPGEVYVERHVCRKPRYHLC